MKNYLDVVLFGVGFLLLLSGNFLYALPAIGLAIAFHDWDNLPRT